MAIKYAKQISGKIVIITGASSGIGEMAAIQLAGLGARVCLVARRESELQRVQQQILAMGFTAWIYPADLADPKAIDALAECILRDHSKIDVLIHNAARSIRRSILESLERMHDYERTMQLNYFGPVRLTLKLLPALLAAGGGKIIISSTMSTQLPVPLFSAYVASKSALESFARSLSVELSEKGLAVTTVHFPMVRTPMSGRTALYRYLPMMSVKQAAGWLVKAVAKSPVQMAQPLGRFTDLALSMMPATTLAVGSRGFKAMDWALALRAKRQQSH